MASSSSPRRLQAGIPSRRKSSGCSRKPRSSAPGGTMRTRSIVALALLCLAAPSLAASSETIRRETLANGLRVILVENHSKPLVAVCIVVNGGSRTETPALSGLSHYYEHLIFRGGSLKQGELEFRKQMQRIGEESGGYTTNG